MSGEKRPPRAYFGLFAIDQTFIWFILGCVIWYGARENNLRALAGSLRPRPPALATGGGTVAPGIGGGGAVAGGPMKEAAVPDLPPVWTETQHPAYTGQKIENTEALDRFYAKLLDVERKKPGSLLRIAHYGDSITSNDAVTRRARDRLQNDFGDGGAGFVPWGLPSRSFRHYSVSRKGEDWNVRSIVARPIGDKLYGFGGASFDGGSGTKTVFSTMSKGTLGTKVSSFDVHYLIQPGGGTFELILDGEPAGTVSTAGDTVTSGFHKLEVPDGPHSLTLRVTSGRVRGFCVVMERPGPGVTYDNLGMASNSAKALKSINREHLKEQLTRHDPDLIVIYIGANESDWYPPGQKAITEYGKVYGELLTGLRQAAPTASCLVFAPTDSAKMIDGEYQTKPALPGIVEAQRRAAKDQGCAFWDAFTWMGGKGSVRKWFKRGEWEPDLMHPNRPGGAKVADGMIDALLGGFDDYRKRTGK